MYRATKGSVKQEFATVADIAEYLECKPTRIASSIKNGHKIKGFLVEKIEAETVVQGDLPNDYRKELAQKHWWFTAQADHEKDKIVSGAVPENINKMTRLQIVAELKRIYSLLSWNDGDMEITNHPVTNREKFKKVFRTFDKRCESLNKFYRGTNPEWGESDLHDYINDLFIALDEFQRGKRK